MSALPAEITELPATPLAVPPAPTSRRPAPTATSPSTATTPTTALRPPTVPTRPRAVPVAPGPELVRQALVAAPPTPGRLQVRGENRVAQVLERRARRRWSFFGLAILACSFGLTVGVLDVLH